MKKLIFFLFLSSCFVTTINGQAQGGYGFTTTLDVEATSVKNQQRTGTCWSFSTASFVESELLRLGNGEFDISEMFVARQIYVEKAKNYVYRQGKAQFSQGSLSHDLMNVVKKYGAVPESAFTGLRPKDKVHNHSELEAVLQGMLDAMIKKPNGKLSPYWLDAIESVLDVYLGEVPESFDYNGKNYTPKSFAKEIIGINPDDYVEITSYTHHPFYEQFILEVPDNFSNGLYYNVTVDELEAIADHALQNGYSIGWDCDVSEKTFSHSNGLAIWPEKSWGGASESERKKMFETPTKEATVTQEMRQNTFEDYSTTDDHLMHITGMAKDKNGAKYYIVKNSWGETGKYKGFLYTSKAYFRLKTVAIMVHKNAIPKNIANKLF